MIKVEFIAILNNFLSNKVINDAVELADEKGYFGDDPQKHSDFVNAEELRKAVKALNKYLNKEKAAYIGNFENCSLYEFIKNVNEKFNAD